MEYEVRETQSKISPGYLGGTVLARLLAHPNASDFEITTIVRDVEKAKKLDSFGVKTVVGSFKSDHVLLQQHVEKAHIVFNCVSCSFCLSKFARPQRLLFTGRF